MYQEQAERVLSAAKNLNCGVVEFEPLKKHTTFRIGGDARLFIDVSDINALCELRKICSSENIPLFMLGNGSNLLVSDDGYDGVVVRLTGDFATYKHEGNKLIAGAGMKLTPLAAVARDKGLSGLEFAYGIPASVGGAVFMNAGAYGGEIKDVLSEVTCVMPDGSVEKFSADELDLSYRHSNLSENGAFVVSAVFELASGDIGEISQKMEGFMEARKTKQPLELPSAGSMFKRPVGYFAAALIDECGLKGLSVGGAQVSVKHAGFVVNTGNASCNDVLELVRKIQKIVYDEKGVELECEVKRLGEFR